MELSRKELQRILGNWDIGQSKSCQLLYSQWNISYKIITPKGKFILKIITMQTIRNLRKELKIISLLKDRIPAYSIIKSKSSKDYLIIKGYPVLIARFVEGQILKDGSNAGMNILTQLGKFLALIHKTKFNGDSTPILKQIFVIMKKIDKRSFEYESINKCMSIIKRRGYDKQKFPKGLIHGDIHTENIIVKNNNIAAILDFESANNNFLIYDIGLVLLDTCFIKNKILSKKRMNAFLRKYEEIRPLKDIEKKYLYDAMLVNWIRILYYSITKYGTRKDILKVKYMKDYFGRIDNLISLIENDEMKIRKEKI